MKVKTSVTLSEEVINEIENIVKGSNRSAFIEKALWSFLMLQERKLRNDRDLEIINNQAEFLNKEAEDVLLFQKEL